MADVCRRSRILFRLGRRFVSGRFRVGNRRRKEAGMDKAHTLKLNKEFRRLYYRGRCQASRLLVLYAGKNHLKTVRLGITAGKKVGGAVERNRAKRVLRAAFAAIEDRLLPGYDIVLVARSATPGVKSQEVRRELEKALGKLELLRQ